MPWSLGVVGRRVVGLAVVATFALPTAAEARKVLVPTDALSFALDGGSFEKRNQDPPAITTFSPGSAFVAGSSIGSDGAITIPAAALSLPTFRFPDFSGSASTVNYTVRDITATVRATAPATGALDPFTGVAQITARLKLYVTYTACVQNGPCYSPGPPEGADACYIGTDANPVLVTLRTGTTMPPGDPTPNRPISGVAYDERDGTLTLVDNAFALPTATASCDPSFNGFRISGAFNNGASLPSPAGNNTLVVAARLTPVARRGVIAALAASPAEAVGSLTTTLDASGSQVPAGVARYAFDLDGDGIYETPSDAPTLTTTFTRVGETIVGVRVVDADGDADVARTRVVVVAAPPPASPSSSPPALAPPMVPAAPPPATTPVVLGSLRFASVVTLPSARRCVKRGGLLVRLRRPAGVRIRSLRVRVSGKRSRTLTGRALRSPVRLRLTPGRSSSVRLTVTTADGRSATRLRRYRSCPPA